MSSSGKPNSVTRKMVRQHAMRGVARARRASRTYGKRNMLQLPLHLIMQESMEWSDKHEWDIGTDKKECTTFDGRTVEMHANVRDPYKVMAVSHSQVNFACTQHLLIERLGAGRHDPFNIYPIEMTKQRQRILDCGKWSSVQ